MGQTGEEVEYTTTGEKVEYVTILDGEKQKHRVKKADIIRSRYVCNFLSPFIMLNWLMARFTSHLASQPVRR
jgi:hypothetical protein